MQAGLLAVAGAGAAIAVVATIADRRQETRADPDRVSLLPLPMIVFAGLLAAVLGLAFGLRS